MGDEEGGEAHAVVEDMRSVSMLTSTRYIKTEEGMLLTFYFSFGCFPQSLIYDEPKGEPTKNTKKKEA